ncbi:adenosine deaminase [Aquisalimonas asiatica]|uniref:Adenine deaminase n=1 Tax=Aquisalimonas asiatica TaxID=406100 RepID=A0A1H8V7N1_9GAMM|nr:adenosine deaminase [Aquisalimonas asiatica]SEP11445.1 adenosine deaminase [Aquisalimonas asiatica]
MRDFIQSLPKVELHVHLEGTLEPELMFQLAERNGVKLPFPDVESVRAAYEFEDLQSFLNLYYNGACVLLEEQDFYDLTRAYLDRVAAENVVHTEMFFDPQTHTERGVPFDTVIGGILRACRDAEAAHGMSTGLILCFLRDLSEASAFDTLEAAMPWREHIVAIGLDSAETGHPPEKFARVFEEVHNGGFRVVAHAGEEGPPEYIRQALDILRVERVDHGVQCTGDPELVKRLAASGICLTVCPLANVKLRVFDTMDDHNLPQLLQAGLNITVNSDDPAYFGGYMNANMTAVAEAFDLDRETLRGFTRNAIDAAFIGEDRRRALHGILDRAA